MGKRNKKAQGENGEQPKVTFDANPENAAKVREEIIGKLGDGYQLDNLDRAILSLMARFPAITHEEIAQATGYSRARISGRTAKPAFKAAQNDMNKGLLQVLMESQLDIIKEMRRVVLTDPEVSNRIAAARVIMGPLNRLEQQAPMQQNIIYTVQFGEGGQIVRKANILDPERVREITAG